MAQWTQVEVNAAIAKVGAKAATDKAFRQLVLTNPNGAIKQVTGMDVPAGFKLKVIENAPGVDQTYVLPDFKSDELSEADLEKVAGGVCGKDMGCSMNVCGAAA